MSDELGELLQRLERAHHGSLLVVTGAGISLASGIPTFRGTDPGAIWKRDVTELGTIAYFNEDPVGSWQWYTTRFDAVFGARPNPAHHALAELERWQTGGGGEFLLVTQNVDTLHEQAGSRALVKVHGSADRVRCSRDGCRLGAPSGSLAREESGLEKFLREATRENLPRCPECGSLLRQHVLWFDELYASHDDYQFERVRRAADGADLYLFVGTSFSVGVTDLVLQAARYRRRPVLSIDPAGSRAAGVSTLAARAEELLPAACRELARPGEGETP